MKNVKWSIVLSLLVMAVWSEVSQSCSSDEYDESTGLKTMARRKVHGGETDVLPKGNGLSPQIELIPGILCYAQFSVSWPEQIITNRMTINKTTDRTNTELFLNKDYKQLLINGELYKDIKIMDLHTDVDVKIIDVNLNSSDIEIGYELSYSFKLCSLDLGESNDTIHGNHNDEFDDSKWTKTPTAIIKGSWHESIKKE